MAQTGVLTKGFHPHPATYAHVVPQAENAAETFPQGAVLAMSGGELTASAGDITAAYGIAFSEGGDLTADRDDESTVFRFEQGKLYEGTFSGTFAEANLPGGASNIVKVTQTAGVPLFIADAGGKWRVERLVRGWNIGDTNPRILATPFDSFIQAGGGNE